MGVVVSSSEMSCFFSSCSLMREEEDSVGEAGEESDESAGDGMDGVLSEENEVVGDRDGDSGSVDFSSLAAAVLM